MPPAALRTNVYVFHEAKDVSKITGPGHVGEPDSSPDRDRIITYSTSIEHVE